MTEADLPILGRRRIEAKRVKPIREGMAARRGKEQAREMLGAAMEMEMLEETRQRVRFNRIRCRHGEMYRDTGLSPIGHLLSCNRDSAFCELFHLRIKLSVPRPSWVARATATSAIRSIRIRVGANRAPHLCSARQ